MPVPLLSIVDLSPIAIERLQSLGFEATVASQHGGRSAAVAASGHARGVISSGTQGLTAAELAQLPNVEIVCAIGAGFEGIDLDVANARGIVVTNGAGTNANAVADHAFALLMALASTLVPHHEIVCRGDWPKLRESGRAPNEPGPAAGLPPKVGVYGKKLGILGLGVIGRRIADRGARGFDMEVAYHNRHPKDDAPYRWEPSLPALAEWADFLVCAAPGGNDTHHIVSRKVLEALGPEGYLVNIGRGSVVDTDALIDALEGESIAGAGLDVVQGEPQVPERLRAARRVVLTPHFAGRSPESAVNSTEMLVSNLRAFFAGEPVRNRVN